jgi:hypothetical protein
MELVGLKKEYGNLAKKHGLPDFKEVNECFEIDRIERDTDFLLREVRKTMMDKVVGYIRFLEMMINPSQAPPMFMMFLKDVTEAEKKTIQTVYKNFIELELLSLKLEVDYSEAREAEAINGILKAWHDTRPDLRATIGVMEKNWNSGAEKKDKGYFG